MRRAEVLSRMRSAALLWVVVLYALCAGVLVTIHWLHWQFGYDSGLYAQVILNAFPGWQPPAGGSVFATHFSPLLFFFYPIAAAHSGLLLQYAQVALIACAPLVLYVWLRPHVDAAVALRMGILAALYPPIAATGIGDFHVLTTLPLLIYALVWSADRGRWAWFAVLGVLLLLVREDVLVELAVIGVAAGIALARSRSGVDGMLDDASRRRRAGLAAVALSAAAFLLACAYLLVIQPRAAGTGWYPALYYKLGLPHGAGVLAAPSVSPPPNPNAPFAITLLQRLGYLLEAFVPLALLPLRTWWWLLAAPGLAIVLAAASAAIWTMGSHYALLWAPWLVIAAAIAIVSIHTASGAVAARRWSDFAIVCSAVFLIAFNPMHLGYYVRPPYHELGNARRALDCVPRGKTVATHDTWFAHMAPSDPFVTADLIDRADYLVYADDYPDATYEREVAPHLKQLEDAGLIHLDASCTFGHVRTYVNTGASHASGAPAP